MSRPSSASHTTALYPVIRSEVYKHSPVHYAVILGDRTTLSRIVSTLPKLADPDKIQTESDSLSQELVADKISAVLDRRDVPFRETPLHLAVRLNDVVAAKILATAGADLSLQNAAGWNPLHESLCQRNSEIAMILVKLHHRAAWYKWRRRLPRVIAVLRRMRDFYMEISFHFESSAIPFVGKIAPSDTYKIWKRDGNLRADTSLAGFDGLKIQRANQSFLFLGDGDHAHNVPPGSLLVLNRDNRQILDAFENASNPMSESDIAEFCAQSCVYRPGMDVTRAELVGKTNWRRQEKTESVGEWKTKIYEIQNVLFSFRSRKVATTENDSAGSEKVSPLELDEDDDGFLVCENPNFTLPDRRRHSSFIKEDREWISVGRKSVDVYPSSATAPPRKSASFKPLTPLPPQTKEKEFLRSLRPSVWLTEQFPLKMGELLPLLDILSNKVKAVRRMRELFTTKFPPGTFPVKVAIPVVPTVRVVITFTKFEELPSTEQFFTPSSSPRNFADIGNDETENDNKTDSRFSFSLRSPSATSSTWLNRNSSRSAAGSKQRFFSSVADQVDPFAIPSGYTWTSVPDKSSKMKRSKSTRKSK